MCLSMLGLSYSCSKSNCSLFAGMQLVTIALWARAQNTLSSSSPNTFPMIRTKLGDTLLLNSMFNDIRVSLVSLWAEVQDLFNL